MNSGTAQSNTVNTDTEGAMSPYQRSVFIKQVEFRENVRASFSQEQSKLSIRHLHISHNARYLSPKIWHILCFSFLLGIIAFPRKIENNAYAKFWGLNKVHYGRCASGE